MTVLIKGMEMPENCGECHFSHTENFKTWCCPTEREDILYDAIPEWCPLAEPKTGEWIEVDSYESEKHSVTDMRCSLCGKYTSIVLPHRTRCVYNFCPYCGARMEGVNDDS